MTVTSYRAILSSDWNECLAPCGPFDFIAFNYPEHQEALTAVFRQYTGNQISLGAAVAQIGTMLPEPISPGQIDTYLDHSFSVYRGVPALIEWCKRNAILFMINTTGMIGYFQRIFAKGLLPIVPVLSACPVIRFLSTNSDPPDVYELLEVPDKRKNTAAAIQKHGITPAPILMGDSGGDGPHFEWGRKQGALLIGSMTKPSLTSYCKKRDITIDVSFGLSYRSGEAKDLVKEMAVDFMDLAPVIEQFLDEHELER